MPKTIKEANAPVATKLKYKGVFDYNKLSNILIQWMRDQKYDFTESVHKHKMSCPHGFEIEREINGMKKIDENYMHRAMIAIHMWDAFEVDAVKDGQKVKLWNARIEVILGFAIDYDYANKWETSPFMEKLRNFYCEYIIKKEIIIKHADPTYYKMLALHTKLKKFFEMETPV